MSVIELPGCGTSPENEIHAEAFRDLEGHISDCVCMEKIASQSMASAKCDDGKLAFTVFHLIEMLLNLKKYYEAAWRGEMPPSRLLTSPAKTTQELKESYGSLSTEEKNEALAPILPET
jgi:hypothetical protein